MAEVAWVYKPKSNEVSLAGEFYTLARLTLQKLTATLTLGNTKGVDILVSNPDTGRLFRVEVKTKTALPRKSGIFGYNHEWIMGEKHETISDSDLVYCFVHLSDSRSAPEFWIVPSSDVAKYVSWQHKKFLRESKKTKGESRMRMFRAEVGEGSPYYEDWSIFHRD